MSIDILDERMRCRVQSGRNGETRVIIDLPTEPAYMQRVMAAISDLAMNQFSTMKGVADNRLPIEVEQGGLLNAA